MSFLTSQRHLFGLLLTLGSLSCGPSAAYACAIDLGRYHGRTPIDIEVRLSNFRGAPENRTADAEVIRVRRGSAPSKFTLQGSDCGNYLPILTEGETLRLYLYPQDLKMPFGRLHVQSGRFELQSNAIWHDREELVWREVTWIAAGLASVAFGEFLMWLFSPLVYRRPAARPR